MKYEKYKDSGLEWVGKVPSHWRICRFKDFTTLQNIASIDEDNKIGLENIEGKTGRFIESSSEFEGNGIQFEIGDIVYGKLRPYLQKVWVATFAGNAVGDFFVFRAKDICYNKYLFYIMLSDGFTSLCNGATLGAKMPRVSSDFIRCLHFFLPPIEEQHAIASYLDKKCRKINTVIDTQKRKIELLNELKQTIITNAVTKGLNPDAPMKDSGAEWIGKVPVHWDVCKIKNILQQGPDSIKIGPFGSSLTGKIGENLSYKVYGQWNIVGGDFNAGTNTVDSETFNTLSKSYRVVSGDILVSMMGTIGKCAIIPENIQDGIMDSHVVKIRLDRSKMETDFFEYFYDKDKSNVIYSQLQKVKGGSIMDGLNSSVIKNLTIVTPPIGEQEEIVKYIKGRIQNIETQIFKTKRRIELLNELKQSIITEAITGKVKVC